MIFLWWIEWATKDSGKIMWGRIATPCQTGGTDKVDTPSGCNTTTGQRRYHYIEDFVGNLYEWIDGVSGSTDQRVWVSANPDDYADISGPTNYKQLTYVTSGSGEAIRAFGWDPENPFLCYYSKANLSRDTQGFCDHERLVVSLYPVMYSGDNDGLDTWCGVCYSDNAGANHTNYKYGGRLLYKPQLIK